MSEAKIKVDLTEISHAMDTDFPESEWFFHLKTGEVILYNSEIEEELDATLEEMEESGDYVDIPSVDSSFGFSYMEEYVSELPEGEAQRSLARSLRMRGPFRAFKDTLFDFPDERKAWFSFLDSKMNEKAQEFLDELNEGLEEKRFVAE